MKLDGFDVKVGDSVYDIVFGFGEVVALHIDSQDRFSVKFGSRRIQTYNEDGYGQFRRRTLYWHDPIVVIPAKQEGAWSIQQEVCLKATEVIRAKAQVLK